MWKSRSCLSGGNKNEEQSRARRCFLLFCYFSLFLGFSSFFDFGFSFSKFFSPPETAKRRAKRRKANKFFNLANIKIKKHQFFICTGGSVVEFSPATREARVRFPAGAIFFQLFCFILFKFYFIFYFLFFIFYFLFILFFFFFPQLFSSRQATSEENI